MNDIWYGLIVGIFIGVLVSTFIYLFVIGKWYIGTLREDNSSGDEQPYYFMEIANGGYSQMQHNKYALLRIRRENYVKTTKS